MDRFDPSKAIGELTIEDTRYRVADLGVLKSSGLCDLEELPVSIRLLLESVLRQAHDGSVPAEAVEQVASWSPTVPDVEVPFMPSRVVLQDLTGVPAVVDLAAMRSAIDRMDLDPELLEPDIPTDLVIDHSVQVDYYGSDDAFERNVALEYERNGERYRALKWAQEAFEDFRVVPPGTGIVHQVNLEYLGRVVHDRQIDSERWLIPDTLVGTDSHTPMIGGIGVLGWGVGGIEAEAAMLGQPITMKLPEVVGVRLHGTLPDGATATDLVLHVTELLRDVGVVDRFVEFFGPGLATLTVEDRATIANMAPEQGSTISFFPVDEQTLEYLALTGRSDAHLDRIRTYLEMQGLFGEQHPTYTETVELDLSTVEPSLAGPSRPQDRVAMNAMDHHFRRLVYGEFEDDLPELDPEQVTRWLDDGGHELSPQPDEGGAGGVRSTSAMETLTQLVPVSVDGRQSEIGHGSVVVSAITSCTNTSNPTVMVAAGLLAKRAVEHGLSVPPHVKTSLAPGSKVVTQYLENADLLEYLEALGYHLVGYGCTTCIGNAGPLPRSIERAIDEHDLWTTSVLSGNRNFEARIHPKVRANYLASPPLVVAYGLAGRMDIDLTREPIGYNTDDEPVYLADLWPGQSEIRDMIRSNLEPAMFTEKYGEVFEGDQRWEALEAPTGAVYEWDDSSTYIREPPFFKDFSIDPPGVSNIGDARCLLTLGDTVTTDHISPAGMFGQDSPAGQWLLENDVDPGSFNTYGARRGNHEVMMRGTYANVRIENQLLDGVEGGYTLYHPTGERMTVFEANERYREEGIPLIVLAGEEFGTGSSRDWAAKGTDLLGIQATIAASYERIFRDNLVGMGVLPLQFVDGESWETLGLDGTERYTIYGFDDGLSVMDRLTVEAEADDGSSTTFDVVAQVGTEAGVAYIEHGGILDYVLRDLVTQAA